MRFWVSFLLADWTNFSATTIFNYKASYAFVFPLVWISCSSMKASNIGSPFHSNLIGVATETELLDGGDSLKRWLLVFDQVAVEDLEKALEHRAQFTDTENIASLAAFRWLQEKALIVDTETILRQLHTDAALELEVASLERSYDERAKQQSTETANRINQKVNIGIKGWNTVQNSFYVIAKRTRFARMLMAYRLRLAGVDAVPIVVNPGKDSDDTLSAALSVVIPQMPTPSEDTPFEAILNFRTDAANREKYHRLRHWALNVGKGADPKELNQELEWLMYEYRTHLEKARIETKFDPLEIVIGGVTSLLTQDPKFMIPAGIKTLFNLSRRSIQLSKVESSAPGRAVAYIAAAQTTFGNPPKSGSSS